MAQTMTWRSSNPALGTDAFRGARGAFGAESMTVAGTVHRTGISLVLMLLAAGYVWNRGPADSGVGAFVMGGAIGALVVAMITVFKQTWAPYTTPAYAVLEGFALGGISVVFEAAYPGIASQAVFLTAGTLGAMLIAYSAGVIRATDKFKLGVVAATGGIALIYVLSFILGFFGVNIPLIHSNGTFGILFSLFVVAIAALNLVLDFDLIEQGARRGAPRYMEWYGAFALLVTLVWLYLEILRLLAKLQSRRE
ncbi:MAG: Bax inhibitor-1/YccA family protein [Acidobacteria bacterium]|nr:Bax inhibitor-1/YccA family protein [Acidobacteriota bacterium]